MRSSTWPARGIADKRWTDDYKKLVIGSRVSSTTLLAKAIAATESKPSVFLSGSAIGFYGDTEDRSVTESATPGQGFLAEVCVNWEAAAAPGRSRRCQDGIPAHRTRHGEEGRDPRPAVADRQGRLGGPLGSGKQYQSWITLEDEVAAIVFLLTADVSGPVNLTAPNPVTQKEFAKTLGHVLHRPALLPAPGFALKLILGQFASEGVLAGSAGASRQAALRRIPVQLDNPRRRVALHSGLIRWDAHRVESFAWAVPPALSDSVVSAVGYSAMLPTGLMHVVCRRPISR